MTSLPNASNYNKGDLLLNSAQSPTFMLPELAKTSGSSHLTILKDSKPSSQDEKVQL